MQDFGRITNFIWSVADLIRDSFRRGKYQDVILPLTVLRRLDCVLAPKQDKVRERAAELRTKGVENPDPALRRLAGQAFYNTSKYTFERLLADSRNIGPNFRAWINGFSPNMREVLEKFEFETTIRKLEEAKLLFQVLERFAQVDLHPDTLDNHAMGTVFEELLRKFNEATNENPGEHFTPRDIVGLMVRLMIAPDAPALKKGAVVRTVYDPTCGTGGMLTLTRDAIRKLNGDADVHLFGQEVNPETYAICKSDLFLSTRDGRDADNILFGSTLSNDQHRDATFDYLIANPPYGKDWKRDEDDVRAEHALGDRGRFGPGLPRISDGQLLFLLHMIAHMKDPADGGSRIAIVMNGSPLFTGDSGSGESEIRRYLLENDLVEAIVAVPEQIFYNTGIATYVWVVTNRRAKARRGKVQLIDASGSDFWKPMRKSLGDKRREIGDEHIEKILALHAGFEDGQHSRILPTTHFGYRRITVQRPLRVQIRPTDERIERLGEQKAFQNLAVSKKKDAKARAAEEAAGEELQAEIFALLHGLPDEPTHDPEEFVGRLKKAAKQRDLKLSAAVIKAIVDALSERDEQAPACTDAEGTPVPDPSLKDTETVPLDEELDTWFAREVLPHVPDAWIDESVVDDKDGKVGRIGYELNFNREFYVYTPPRPLEEIEADIRQVEAEILELLKGVAGKPEGAE